MNSQLKCWLSDFEREFRYADANSPSQADENLHSYSLTNQDRENVTTAEIVDFIESHCDIASGLVLEDATFYAWVDELAGQIRFSIVSGHDAVLPFGCAIQPVDLATVAEQYQAMTTSLHAEVALRVWRKQISSRRA